MNRQQAASRLQEFWRSPHGPTSDVKAAGRSAPIRELIGDDARNSSFSELQLLRPGHDRVLRVATGAQGWLQTPHDCGYAIIVRDAEAHRRAMTIAASHLPSAAAGDRDPSHFVPELRRARGFATWAMIRHLGRAGIAALIQGHCHLAARFAERLVREPGV